MNGPILKDSDGILDESVSLAESWQTRAEELLTSEERTIQDQMKRLLNHPKDKVILTRLIDQSFRSENPQRVADQINTLLREYGVPEFFSRVDRLLVQMFLGLGRYLPSVSVPKMIGKMRQDSSRAIIPGEPDVLSEHLNRRKSQGVRMNINHLGEAILGEDEARRRLVTYIEDLKNPDIEVISVKMSTIYSQINPLAFECTLGVLTERLTEIYRAAKGQHFIRNDGTRVPKIVNLDMEEYRDLELTIEAFQRSLEQEEFLDYPGGIVLQAYLPDSYDRQVALTEWARKRVAAGGSPIKLRIVKGANMEMELVESAISNWPLAAYDNKLDVDANYKRMVRFGMDPDNIQAVHLGIGSHNLFELAYACALARHLGVTEYFYFEMLEGMADHVRRALAEMAGDVLLYAPVASRAEFIHAIAYLVRRLDENTAEENFLRYAPGLRVGTPTWEYLKEQFLASCARMETAPTTPRRTQDRSKENFPKAMGTFYEGEFNNEPDTDWSLKANRLWAEAVREKWKKAPGDPPLEIPVVVGGEEIYEGREIHESWDKSRHAEGVRIARFALGNEEDVSRAVATAKEDPDGWRDRTARERHEVLSRVAMEIRKARGDLVGAAAAVGAKVFSESDAEVSEAIDFAEYYPFSVKEFAERETLKARGKGVGVVISPWNFPIAIPCGGVVASLAAGNTVILKPATDVAPVAWVLCQCFWRAGVSRRVLQFLPCAGSTVGSRLASHPDVDFIILTGGTETGLRILQAKPDVFLSAETGGKNATVVTAMSDRDQAIKNILYSAFGNGGQKCSATSLLILEPELYEDEKFRRHLVDAARSYRTGSVWNFENRMGPLIRPPEGDLRRALTQLEPGESWALEPENIEDNPCLWTPGIKWDVQPGSYTHMTEFFGPVLGVMRAENLEHAIDLVNQTGYGLTSGIESLDRREQETWKAGIRCGNLYINRGNTGAVTLRQPFGGMGKSALGPAIKAGSPSYVASFMRITETAPPRIGAIRKESGLLRLVLEWRRKLLWDLVPEEFQADIERTVRAVKSYLYHYEQAFGQEKDFFHLRGQDNLLRYLPLGKVAVRLHPDDTLFDVLARVAASRICQNETVLSLPPGLDNPVTAFLRREGEKRFLQGVHMARQSDEDLVRALDDLARIRYASHDRVSVEVLEAAAERGFYIAREPVLMEGRVELLHYVQNQSVCDMYHRYGNLGERAFLP
ncbi:MAG: bifunctional proline dehydrogenase/L-glutamate gamma-semialdehyde dehydrogenase [Desulfobacteraceae bacterium]|jgi:RHH-type proline utilization regulon transcriptional repressor/proline dehydrogenase/delta 1-pyrroline-5-carboxylate dehydrogenase